MDWIRKIFLIWLAMNLVSDEEKLSRLLSRISPGQLEQVKAALRYALEL